MPRTEPAHAPLVMAREGQDRIPRPTVVAASPIQPPSPMASPNTNNPNSPASGRLVCCMKVATAKPERRMASSSNPVCTTCPKAPTEMAIQNRQED